MKSLLTERVERGCPDEPLLAATQSHGVIRKADYGNRTVTASKDLHLLKLVQVDDFVISLRSFQGGIERCHDRGIISPAYTVLTARSSTYRNYLTYLFKSKPFVSSLQLSVTGIREGQNIDYSKVSVELLPVPPAEDQAAIVKYLTYAIARIEKVAAAKRHLITLLEEQTKAAIERLVTRGVHEAPELRQTGLAWLPYAPAHWTVVRAKYLLNAIDVRSQSGAEQLLTVSSAHGVVRRSDTRVFMFEAGSYVGHKLCWPGDLVINSLWAWAGGLGVAGEHGIVSTAYGVYRARDLDCLSPWYLHHFVRSQGFNYVLRVESRGIWKSRLQLTDDRFLASSLLVPPIEEQHAIIRSIEAEQAVLMRATERLRKEIGLLHELRVRLIADVVTGQVDVRGAAASLPEIDVQTSQGAPRPDGGLSSDSVDEAIELCEV
jgi:type I restriction enzyme S subunit